MKMMNKTSVALAVATCLGMASPQTFAIIKLKDPSPTTPAAASNAVGGPVLFAAEQSGESSLIVYSAYGTGYNLTNYANGDLSVIIPAPASYAVTTSKSLFVRTTLTSGAKFANEPYLICPTVGKSALDMTNANNANIVSAADIPATIAAATTVGLMSTATSPAAGKVTATFNVVSGVTLSSAGHCLLTFSPPAAVGTFLSAYTVTNRGQIGLNVEIGYVQGGLVATAVSSGVFMSFVTALKAEVTSTEFGGVNPAVTIDVKQASKKFVAGNAVTPTVATLGSVKITSANANANIRLAAVTASDKSAANILTTGTVTVSGALLAGVQSIALYQAAGCTTMSTVPAGTPAATSAGVAATITLSNIPIAELIAGLNICATVPGTTTLNGGQLSAVLVGGGVDKFVPDLGAGNNIALVGINGSRARVLNIPPANNADQVFLRFYNTSSQDTVVRGTLYGQDGKILGTENVVLFNPLKANDVEILDATGLATKIGGGTAIAPWTGRAWLLVQAEVESSSFKVQGLVRTPSNVLVNLSTDATN